MDEVRIDENLVGKTVRNAARPEWGDGKVLRVQKIKQGGQDAHRVSVQFHVGHKTLLVPPARLAWPTDEPVRQTGWLSSLGGATLDDQLRKLPPDVAYAFGTLEQRLTALLPMFAYDEAPASLAAWARRQTGAADPLSQWNRDELEVAFQAFCQERDAQFRALAATWKHKEGPDRLREFLASLPAEVRPAVTAALQRVI